MDITLHVLAALEEIHSHHIIHRDISPDNVFLCSNHRVKVIDFGAASRFSSGEESSNFSTIVKPGYALRRNSTEPRADTALLTDLYALGSLHVSGSDRRKAAGIFSKGNGVKLFKAAKRIKS